MNNQIPDLLFKLVYSNLYASSEGILVTALKNRFIGFRAEIELQKLFAEKKFELFEGGFIVPLRDGKETLNAPIYFTVDHRPASEYKQLYEVLNDGNFSKLIYIRFDIQKKIDQWKSALLQNSEYIFPIPHFRIYDFQKNNFIEAGNDLSSFLSHFTSKKEYFKQRIKISAEPLQLIKSYLNDYDETQLLNLYVSRLVFDGFIGLMHFKGIPSDIDLIRKDHQNYKFYEVKEKDLSKTNPIGFGIDVQRLEDCLKISQVMKVKYTYIVRQVDNQTERNFISWRYIDFENFEKNTDKSKIKQGGTGMNTGGSMHDNPTLLVEEKHFGKIEN
jgi:hypothetical protein